MERILASKYYIYFQEKQSYKILSIIALIVFKTPEIQENLLQIPGIVEVGRDPCCPPEHSPGVVCSAHACRLTRKVRVPCKLCYKGYELGEP